MKVEYYNPVDEKGGCVVRSISKALDSDYNQIKRLLQELSDNYNDEIVFESFLKERGFVVDTSCKDQLLKDITYNGTNIVFGYCEDWYHMMCIIDNVIYDKNSFDELANLKIIKIYKVER